MLFNPLFASSRLLNIVSSITLAVSWFAYHYHDSTQMGLSKCQITHSSLLPTTSHMISQTRCYVKKQTGGSRTKAFEEHALAWYYQGSYIQLFSFPAFSVVYNWSIIDNISIFKSHFKDAGNIMIFLPMTKYATLSKVFNCPFTLQTIS